MDFFFLLLVNNNLNLHPVTSQSTIYYVYTVLLGRKSITTYQVRVMSAPYIIIGKPIQIKTLNELQKYECLRDHVSSTNDSESASGFKLQGLWAHTTSTTSSISAHEPTDHEFNVPVSGMVHLNRPPQGRTPFIFIGLKSWRN